METIERSVDLLMSIADPTVIHNSEGALHAAARTGNTTNMEILIEHGFGIEGGGVDCGRDPVLLEICMHNAGPPDAVRLLVERGANLHVTDCEGKNIRTYMASFFSLRWERSLTKS